ncbi:hypothetical protein NDI56_15745 [Haloarcula sp. S1CR25-12]|uniref:Uncharacterized protein n=1 Tax=Haloarcula saliterrae TaxID=2950534 RepID=A0ABU2FF24_9EURY|nr:hypothetical protein [Haloarcula sp. S1CR25-12]MDS0260858.1 hypothetical protein [Haloarcula sp. S1CR25-12]
MLRRLRENGPVVLVPLAWTFATAAHLDLLTLRTVLIAHLVMDAIIAAFTVLSWREMTDGVLLVWKRVLLAGLAITLVGTAGLLTEPPVELLLSATVVGWMLVPGAGLLATGRLVDRRPRAYLAGGALSVAGAVAYVGGLSAALPAALVAGLTLTNVGQTAGIVAAVYDY